MSLFELLVIFIVAFLVIKPEDLPKIVKKIKEFNKIFVKTKGEIISYLDVDSSKNNIKIEDDIDQINFYLEKIAKLGNEYEGEYSLARIKDHYHNTIKKSIKSAIKDEHKIINN